MTVPGRVPVLLSCQWIHEECETNILQSALTTGHQPSRRHVRAHLIPDYLRADVCVCVCVCVCTSTYICMCAMKM